VAKDRVISTVDPEARHGHKTAARSFDGYKGHIAIDPDSEIITATEVTPGNVADGSVADVLLADVLPSMTQEGSPVEAAPAVVEAVATATRHAEITPSEVPSTRVEIYGDASYGTADLVEKIEAAGAEANVKVQAPSAPAGRFGKDAFAIDVDAQTVKCPAGVLVQIRKHTSEGGGIAMFAASCSNCALRTRCTDAKGGRAIRIHPKEATLQRCRARQRSSTWKERYRATRPKVERKLAHLMVRRHGGRRARVRGTARIRQDFAMLAAAQNLARFARLGVRRVDATWVC
jgi:hypothetical protein